MLPMTTVEGIEIPKLKDKWTEEDMKCMTLNAKAMKALVCAASLKEFNGVSTR